MAVKNYLCGKLNSSHFVSAIAVFHVKWGYNEPSVVRASLVCKGSSQLWLNVLHPHYAAIFLTGPWEQKADW